MVPSIDALSDLFIDHLLNLMLFFS